MPSKSSVGTRPVTEKTSRSGMPRVWQVHHYSRGRGRKRIHIQLLDVSKVRGERRTVGVIVVIENYRGIYFEYDDMEVAQTAWEQASYRDQQEWLTDLQMQRTWTGRGTYTHHVWFLANPTCR